jgi:hypothetical protein
MQKAKVIDSDGDIVEGQLLTPKEAEIFEDPLFDNVAFNVAVRGTYFSGQSIRNTLAYILTHYTITKRDVAVTEPPAPLIVEAISSSNNWGLPHPLEDEENPIDPAAPTAINI